MITDTEYTMAQLSSGGSISSNLRKTLISREKHLYI